MEVVLLGEEEVAADMVETAEVVTFLGGTLTTTTYTDTVNQVTPPLLGPLMVTPVAVEAVARILVPLVGMAVDQTMATVRDQLLLAGVVEEGEGEDVSKAVGAVDQIDSDTAEIMVDTKVKGGETTRRIENPPAADTRVITSMASLRFVWLLRVVDETSVN